MTTISLLPRATVTQPAMRRLLVACGMSVLLHVTLLLGIPVNPTGGIPSVATTITARLEAAPAAEIVPDVEPPSGMATSPAPDETPSVARDLPAQPADPKSEARAVSKSAMPESKAAAPPLASPSPGLEVPLIRDPVYYPARQLDVFPQPLAEIRPACPSAAVAGRINGRVQLLLLIDEFGAVNEASVVEAQPDGFFEEAALPAFRAARFSPAQKQGHSVKSRILLRVNFLCGDNETASRG